MIRLEPRLVIVGHDYKSETIDPGHGKFRPQEQD